jgi:hypothetical protein
VTLVPDLAAPIAGWRIWNVMNVGRGLELISPIRPVPWRHRSPTTATCGAGCALCPSPTCRCGLYATAGLDVLMPLAHRGGAAVLGCTALWGRVVEHTDGWRGEHGYPLVLFVLSGMPEQTIERVRRLRRARWSTADGSLRLDDCASAEALARELARLYGVPVHPAPDVFVGVRGGTRAGGPADAVRSEAAAGLAGRRGDDPAAHGRLTRCVQDLLDASGE